MRLQFTIEQLEYILLILARVSAFVFTAPFFNLGNAPMRIKAGFSAFFALLVYFCVLGSMPTGTVPGRMDYVGVLGFSMLVIEEIAAGILLGYFTNIVLSIVNFAGRIIDMEIGLAMVTELDPITKVQSSVSGNLYTYFLTLTLLVSGFHRFLIKAFVETYQVVPVGGVTLRPGTYTLMLQFMRDYFLIAFRIVLPLYGTMLLVNVVLGIMAKVAPQMNMFVVGIQLKILFGLAILMLMIFMLPGVTDFIVGEMKDMFRAVVEMISS